MLDHPCLPRRFWDKVSPEPNTGCWIWTSALRSGYGRFWLGRRCESAHILAYAALVAPVPKGLQLDHRCNQRSCVNPAHLEPVTPKSNCLRRSRRRCHACGAIQHVSDRSSS